MIIGAPGSFKMVIGTWDEYVLDWRWTGGVPAVERDQDEMFGVGSGKSQNGCLVMSAGRNRVVSWSLLCGTGRGRP